MKKTFFLISIYLVLNLPSQASPDWEVSNPRPLPGDVSAIDSPAPDTVWAASDASMLVRLTDNGRSSTIVALPRQTRGKLLIDFLNGRKGYVVAADDPATPFSTMVFYTEDGGANWRTSEVGSQQDPFKATTLRAVGEAVLIGGILPGVIDQAVVYRLTNNVWTPTFLPGESVEDVRGLWLQSQTQGWAVGENGYLAGTVDGGRNWQRIQTQIQTDLNAVFFSTPLVGWIGGGDFNSFLLYKTTNGGTVWQEVADLEATSKCIDIRPFRAGGVAVVSHGGGDPDLSHLFVSPDGRSWSTAGTFDNQLLGAMSSSGESIWIAGENGFIARSMSGGAPEITSIRATIRTLTDISFTEGNAGWAVGEHGVVIRSLDGGFSWTEVDNFPPFEPVAVVGFGIWRAIVSCHGSRELLTTNGGVTWREVAVSEGIVTDFEVVGETVYASAGGTISVSGDRGDHWSESIVRRGRIVLDIEAFEGDSAFATVLRDSVFVTYDRGRNWKASLIIPPNTRKLCYLPSGLAYAAVETENGTSVYKNWPDWQRPTRVHSLRYDVKDMEYYGDSSAFVLGEGGEFERLQLGTISGISSGLHHSALLMNIELLDDWIWVCGSGGFIARWGENFLGVREDQSVIKPEYSLLIAAWPNPTNGKINFQLPFNRPGVFNIYNCDGRSVTSFNNTGDGPVFSVDLSDLNSGVYFVRSRDSFSTSKPIVLLK